MTDGVAGARPSEDGEAIRLLHVDDDPAVRDVTTEYVSQQSPAFEVVTAGSGRAGLSILAEEQIDCVVSDYDMPGMDGLEFLAAVRDRHGDLPFVLFTGMGSEEIASEAIAAGVTDYLQKDTGTEQYEMLAKRVENAVERHRAESQLVWEQRRYELIGRASADAFWDLNVETEAVERSEGFARLFGYENGAVGTDLTWWRDRIHPEDRERVMDLLERTIQGGASDFETEYRFRNADGSYSRVVSHGYVVEERGEPTRVVGAMTDVTEISQRERALEDVQSRLELVLEGTGTGVWEWDAGTDEVRWDETTERLFDVDPGSFEGTYEAFLRRVHPEDRQEVERAATRAVRENEPYELEFRVPLPDGSTRWIEAKGFQLSPGGDGLGGMLGLVTDVTDRKEREQALERYRTVVEASGDGLYALDRTGHYAFVNQAHADLAGYEPAEMVGEHVSIIVGEEDVERGTDVIEELLASDDREHATFDVTVETADGDEVSVENQVGLLRDASGEFRGTVGVFRDVSKRAERERVLEALHEATRRLVRADTREEVASLTAEAAEDILGYDENLVRLLEDDGRLVPYAITGAMRERLGDRPVYRVGEEPVGLAFERGEPLVYDDARSIDDGFDRSPGANLYVPIGRYGVMTISGREYGSLEDADVRLASLLAANAETAFERIEQAAVRREHERALGRLHDATRQLLSAETKAEVAQHVAETAKDILGHPMSSVRLRTEDGRRLEPVVTVGMDGDDRWTYGIDEGLSGRALAEGEVQIIDDLSEFGEAYDEWPFESAMVLPIGDHGTLGLGDTGSGRFGESEQRLAAVLAANAEAVLDRVENSRGLAKQNERLERFATVLSHDLRNPLNIAAGRVELAGEKYGGEEFEAIQEALARMNEIIDDVLSLARGGEAVVDPDVVQLDRFVDAAWDTTDPSAGTLSVDGELGTIVADGTRLKQLLENLFGNAIEHAGPGVTVHVGRLNDDRGGFYVEDDGPGVPAAEQARIFESGYSTATGGTGFGLAIASEIAEAHGWEIVATEADSGGARFEIRGVGDLE